MASELISLAWNDSNWKYLNEFNNLTSKIAPSRNLQYWTHNASLNGTVYTFLRYNPIVTRFKYDQGIPGIALDYWFRPNTFNYDIPCTFPISGQYGPLNRLLFYLLMIFALVARRRTWLAAAALGTAMTYAASAAVHAFALFM